MRTDDFDFIARYLKDHSGLNITSDKAYLLESRLMPLVRKHNLKNISDLFQVLRVSREQALGRDIVEAMTINESAFFRDVRPFEQFKEIVLPHLLKTRADRKSFRIWSAAASSGQEPYSLAMILMEEAARMPGWKIDIIGTDISSKMLNKAKAGLYSQFEVQRGLQVQYLLKYFEKNDEMWEIDPAIRAMVQFKEYNLLHDLRSLGQFDVVFCRNVLIYLDQSTRAKVLENISRIMPKDGFLYLGGAETVLGISNCFKPVPGQPGIYGVNHEDSVAVAISALGSALTGKQKTAAFDPGNAASLTGAESPCSPIGSAGLGAKPLPSTSNPFGVKK